MNKEFPWCGNSRRWITVMFDLDMPKSCPNDQDKCCQMEECAYFQWKEESEYLRWVRRVLKKVWCGAEIITSKEEWENPDREVMKR